MCLKIAFLLPASLQSGRRSPVFLVLAGLLLVLTFVGGIRVTFPPGSSPAVVAKKIVYPSEHGRVSSRDPVARHGGRLVRALIREVHAYPEERARLANGDNQGLKDALLLLGQAGTPAAVAELRPWLYRDVAKDVRAAAALALGRARDTESAPHDRRASARPAGVAPAPPRALLGARRAPRQRPSVRDR